MPRLDGPSTLKEIRSREKGIWAGRKHVVVALTDLQQPGDRKRLIELGFDDYLPKPLEEGDLHKVLERHLNALGRDMDIHAPASTEGPDWEPLAQALGGREGLLEFLAVFMQDSEGRQIRIHEAFQAGDRLLIRREAHDLKSNAGTLGFLELAETCKGLEKNAEELSEADLRDRLACMDQKLEEAFGSCRLAMGRA